MGYTHYWYQKRNFTAKEWSYIKLAAMDADKKYALANGMGEINTPACIDDNSIVFNGVADMSHETFILDRIKPDNPEWRKDEKEYFAFCKTACKPYDAAVVDVLNAAKTTAPDAIELNTDGDMYADGQLICKLS